MSGKYALIIGNTEYIDLGLAQLTAPGKDAEDFARVLKDPKLCGFDTVKILLNQLSSFVIEAVDEFFDQKKPDDLLVLYFSGHGVRDELGALYLAVRNTNRFRLRSTAIKSDFIREAMDQSRSKRQVLILDCCNSGAFAQGTKAATGGSIGTASAFEAGYGRIILTASDSTQFAWEGNQVIGETNNSLFTHFLVEGLEGEADLDGDGRITVDELYDYAYEKVRLVTPKQTPSKFSSKQQGEIVLRQIIHVEDIKPQPLPPYLNMAIENPDSDVRLGAVQSLTKLLGGRNLGLARSAREVLERLEKEDDSRRVSQAATQALLAIRQAEAERKAAEETKQLLSAQKVEEEHLIAGEVDKVLEVQKLPAAEKAKPSVFIQPKEIEKESIATAESASDMPQANAVPLKRSLQFLENIKTRKLLPALILILVGLVIVSAFLWATSNKFLVTDPPAITLSYNLSNLSTALSESTSSSTASFSRDQDIFVNFNINYVPTNTPFEARWYHQLNILGKEVYFQIAQGNFTTTGAEQYLFFKMNNPGTNGYYRVDIYMNQDLVGTRYFWVQ